MNLKDPESMNVIIGNVLRIGVIVSALVIIVGTLQLAATGGFNGTSATLTYYPNTVPHGNFDVSLGGLLSGLASFKPFSLIELGVIFLIATPVSRVSISIFLFAAEKDRLYVVVTTVVLALLLFSMLVTPFIPGFHA